MAKKVLSWISFGVSTFIVLLHMMSTFMAPGDDWKPMLLSLGIGFIGVLCGLIGCLIIDKNKIVSGILLLIAILGAGFLGMMTMAGGLEFLGIIGLPLGIINAFLYLVSAILVFVSKPKS